MDAAAAGKAAIGGREQLFCGLPFLAVGFSIGNKISRDNLWKRGNKVSTESVQVTGNVEFPQEFQKTAEVLLR